MAKFDQKGQKVENQWNVNIESAGVSASELYYNAKNLLKCQEYAKSYTLFLKALAINPNLPNIQYYIVLTSMKGIRPRQLSLSAIQSIEKRLEVASRMQKDNSHIIFLWALVKEDYYGLNCVYEKPPLASDLITQVTSITPDHQLELLTHIPASNNPYWEWLRTQ